MSGDPRIDELIVAYLAGDIGPQDLAELEARLAADSKARDRFAEICQQDVALRGVLACEKASAESPLREKTPRPRKLLGRLSVRRGRPYAVPALMAAGVLVGAIGLWMIFASRPDQGTVQRPLSVRGTHDQPAPERPLVGPGESPPKPERQPRPGESEKKIEGPPRPAPERVAPPTKESPPPKVGEPPRKVQEKPPAQPGETVLVLAIVEGVRGQVFLVRDVERKPAQAGDGLLSGRGVETVGRESLAVVRYADGTRVELGGETAVREFSQRAGKRIALEKGTLTAEVAKQPPDQPMVFTTPHGEAKIAGTTLKLVVEGPRTRLEVMEGKVKLKTADGKTIDVGGGHYAVAGAGVKLATRTLPYSPGALLAGEMPPKSWLAVPNTRLRDVVPDPAKYPNIQGTMGPRGIMESWSGGAFDTRRGRLIVWGGGSTNYRGNEIYAFDVHALRWKRVTDPSPDPVDGGQVNPDGTPNIRDTFNGLAYMAHADRFFAMGGSLSGTAARRGADIAWTFDFASQRWIDSKPSGPRPPTGEGDNCAYDPVSRKVWFFDSNNVGDAGLYSFDLDANRWMKHTGDHLPHHTCAIDPRRGLLVAVGAGEVVAFDLRRGPTRHNLKTSGGDRLVGTRSPGLDYDPVRGRFVGWAGGPVYALDPETKNWTVSDSPAAPAPTPNGIFGRWRYVPGLDVFVLATTIDEEVHFYKPGK